MSVKRENNVVKIHRAPLTLAVILDVKSLMRDADLTLEQYREVINKFLPAPKHIEPGHAGIVKLNRWLNPSSSGWQEPRAEIILAMQKTIAILSEMYVDKSVNKCEPVVS
jgi:hypothetical protein